MAWKGRYSVKNPSKYKGDPSKVVYRSSLEWKLMNYLDKHPDVIWWQSEETIVPYRCVTDNRMHRYFVDFTVKRKGRDGREEVLMIEVKPASQCKPPTKKTRKTRRYITEVLTWGKNQSKWEAANDYAQKRGWRFIILNESDINNLG